MANATQMMRPPGPAPRTWVGPALIVLLCTAVGVVIGGLVNWSGPRYSAGAELVVTGVGEPTESLYAIGQYEIDRAGTWATIAASSVVADAAAAALGEEPGALEGATTAIAPTAETRVVLTVEAPDPDQAVRRAGAVAEAAVVEINRQEALPGRVYPRAVSEVLGVDDDAEDARFLDTRLAAVPGGVIGLLVGWVIAAIRRPGGWVLRLAHPLDREGQRDELQRIDQNVQIDVLGALLLGQSGRGLLIAALAMFGVFGYAFTGSAYPPLLVVLIAGFAGIKDLRIAAGSIVFAGATVLPAKIELIDLGLFTPTVLEVAIGFGLVLTYLQWRRDPDPPGVFDGPVWALAAAVVIGSGVSLAQGNDLSDVIDTARILLVVLSFFVIRRAFRGQPYLLFAVMLITAAAAAVVALMGVGLGLEALNPDPTDYVITGDNTAEVNRINTPALELWSPLLVVLAAGVVRLRPRWLWAVVLIPCLALQALSFDRTTWATLLALAVVVAVLRGGRSGVVSRAIGVVVIGAVGLGALSAGAFGPEGQAVALRLSSVVTGAALSENSLTDRLEENEAARATLQESPYVGTGIGAHYGAELVTYNDTLAVLDPAPRPWIHNQYYRIWLWMGVLGLIAYGWVAVRTVSLSFHAWKRRGQAATTTVAAAAGLASIAAQAVFATNLDFPATILSVCVVLALMELAATTNHRGSPTTGARRVSPDRVASASPGVRP